MTETFDILKDYADYLNLANLFTTAFRVIGWAILSLFRGILDGMEVLLDSVYSLAEFPVSKEVTTFIEKNQAIIFSIGSACLVWFFFRYMNNKNVHGKSLIDNLLMGTMVVIASATVIATLTTGAFGLAKAVYSDGGSTSSAIYNENIVDVLSFDKQGWEGADKVKTITYKADQLKFLDITQEVNQKKQKFENKTSKEIFSNRLENGSDGELTTVELETGLFKFDEHYYRFSWHPWIIFFTILTSILVLALASFKYLHAMYNIAYNSVIMPFFAYSDLVEGTKVKKIIQGTINLLINVILFAVSLKVYRLFSVYINAQDLGLVVKMIFQILLVFAVIEGPYIIQELTGYEGGLKSSIRQAATLGAAAYFGGKKLGVKDKISAAKDKIQSGIDYAEGAIAGTAEGIKDKLGVDSAMKGEQSKENKAPEDLSLSELSDSELEEFSEAVKSDLNDGQVQFGSLQPEGYASEGDVGETEAAASEPSSTRLEGTNGAENHDIQGLEAQIAKDQNKDIKDYNATKVPDSMSDLMGNKPGSEQAGESQFEPKGSISSQLPQTLSQSSQALDQLQVGQEGQNEALTNISVPKNIANLDGVKQFNRDMNPVIPQVQGSLELDQPQFNQSAIRAVQTQSGSMLSNVTNGQTMSRNQTMKATVPRHISSRSGTQQFNRDRNHLGLPQNQARTILSGGLVPVPVAQRSIDFVKAPKAITSQPGVQQLQTDIANSGKPLSNQTIPELIKERIADKQIATATKRRERLTKHFIGKNTGNEFSDHIGRSKKQDE